MWILSNTSDAPPITTVKHFSALNLSSRSIEVCRIIFTKTAASVSSLNIWFFDWRHYISCKVGNEF